MKILFSSRTWNKVLGVHDWGLLVCKKSVVMVARELLVKLGKEPGTVTFPMWGSRPFFELCHSTTH